MNTRYRKLAALLAGFLLMFLVGGVWLWMRSAQKQYALNRQLIAALVQGDDRQALALVNEGADPNTRFIPTPVPALLQFVKQLLHRTPPPVNDSPTALSIACGAQWNDDSATIVAQLRRLDAPQLVQVMLTHGAKVNAQDKDRQTPLLHAVRFNRRNTIGLLLEHGADPNTKDWDGWTPLFRAVLLNHPDTVGVLLAHGINVNAKAEDGETPLMAAASYSAAPDTVRLLLKYGADVNAKDEDEETALNYAVRFIPSPKERSIKAPKERSIKECIRQVLAHGANPNLANKDGQTPLAAAQGHPDIVALLKHYGARK